MTKEQQKKLLIRLHKQMKKHPVPILNKEGEDIPVVLIDKLLSDWVFKHMFPTAELVKDTIGAEMHRILSRDGYTIVTKPWSTDLMATYSKAGSSPVVPIPGKEPWLGR